MTSLKYAGRCASLTSLRAMVSEPEILGTVDVELTMTGSGIEIRSEVFPFTKMTITSVQGLFFADQRFIGLVSKNKTSGNFTFFLFCARDFDSSFSYIEDQCSLVPQECFEEFYRNESLEFYGSSELKVFLENDSRLNG